MNDSMLKNIPIHLPLQSLSKAKISVYAFNNDRVKSITKEDSFSISQTRAKKGKLYILTIAVSDNANVEKKLNHTTNECEAFFLNLSSMVDKSEFNEIKRISLLSQGGGAFQTFTRTTTKEEIAKKFMFLKREIMPEDNLVIFHSGHGLIDLEGKFYIVPYDFNKNNPYKSSISGSELSSWIEGIDAKSIFVFIDACYSGGIENLEYISGPFGDPGFGQLSYNKLVPILTSARKEEQSFTMGLGVINKRLKENIEALSSQNLFDLMLNISLRLSTDNGQNPQFLFWGKHKPTDIQLNKEQ